MKKYYITFIVLSLISFGNLQAQCKYGPRLSLGLSGLGGGNSSFAFQAGIFINAELKDRIGVQGEVLYSMKNGNTTETRTNSTGDKQTFTTKYNFAFVEIPIYGFVPLSEHITFLFGPQLNVVNKGTTRLEGPGVTGDSAEKQNISDLSTGLGIATGIDFKTASPLRFGLRYSSTGGDPFKGKSSFVGVTIGYTMDW